MILRVHVRLIQAPQQQLQRHMQCLTVHVQQSESMHEACLIVPRRRVLSMRRCIDNCRWLIERSHSQFVTASVFGRLRAMLCMPIIF